MKIIFQHFPVIYFSAYSSSEEAERMWHRRQAEWEKEQKARDKLMNEVLQGLQKQVKIFVPSFCVSVYNKMNSIFIKIQNFIAHVL